MTRRLLITRRDFLVVTATAAGGLLVGAKRVEPSQLTPGGDDAVRVTPFVVVHASGVIEIFTPKPDVGTGTNTSLAMLVAEELEADWSTIVVRQADIDQRTYGDQGVGGSDSIASSFDPLRHAGAVARTLLIRAAAARWNVPASRCSAKLSKVVNSTTGATLPYGALAHDAALVPAPTEPVALKGPDAWSLIGTRRIGPVVQDIVTGVPLYGIDVDVPGMLHVAIVKAPVHGGRVRTCDDRAARAIPGVRRVIVMPGAREHIWMRPGVAVLADDTWTAIRARDALEIEWDTAGGDAESDAALFDQFARASVAEARTLRENGHVVTALDGERAVVDAVYELPLLYHAPMEPMNAAARWSGARCEIWGPIQLPEKARTVVASTLGIDPSNITIHVTRIGGGFGRRLLSDYAVEAAWLSREARTPVQVTWTREDDVQHDYYRPASRHHVRAAVGADGRIAAWDHHLVGMPNDAYPGEVEADGLLASRSVDAGADVNDGLQPCLIPHYRLRVNTVRSVIPTGSLRAPAHNSNAFVVESMIDELAHASDVDPIELRRRMLGSVADFPSRLPRRPWFYDPARLARVLEVAAARAGWPVTRTAGEGAGIASHFAMNSYAAHVIDVAVDSDRRLTIRRVIAVLDCGIVVNPSGVLAQVQGATIDALAAALFGNVRVERGRTVQRNFDTWRLLRNREAPAVEVYIVPSDAPPTGAGEPPYPSVAPALTNAIFAATGERIRRLPVESHGIRL
jgi:isoquinoline 1-oxidoreductase subunit beta